MKIGIMSDSHENMPLIAKAVAYFNTEGAELVLHAGDIISPITFKEFRLLKCRMIAVYGNNDGEKKMLAEQIKPFGEIHAGPHEFSAGGLRFILMHEPRDLEGLAASRKYDVIVYGHTHKPDIRRQDGTLIVNPGECAGWLTGRSTVALLELPSKEAALKDL